MVTTIRVPGEGWSDEVQFRVADLLLLVRVHSPAPRSVLVLVKIKVT